MTAASRPRTVHPHITLPRVFSGAVGGVAGGLAFGILMLSKVIGRGQGSLEGEGVIPAIAELIGTDNLVAAWGIHIASSLTFGVIFGLLVAPTRYMRVVAWAFGWSILLWLVGDFFVVRSLLGEPIVFDEAAVFSLQGHLLYGLVLGFTYVAFHSVLITDEGLAPGKPAAGH